jgi:hypothetical protein
VDGGPPVGAHAKVGSPPRPRLAADASGDRLPCASVTPVAMAHPCLDMRQFVKKHLGAQSVVLFQHQVEIQRQFPHHPRAVAMAQGHPSPCRPHPPTQAHRQGVRQRSLKVEHVQSRDGRVEEVLLGRRRAVRSHPKRLEGRGSLSASKATGRRTPSRRRGPGTDRAQRLQKRRVFPDRSLRSSQGERSGPGMPDDQGEVIENGRRGVAVSLVEIQDRPPWVSDQMVRRLALKLTRRRRMAPRPRSSSSTFDSVSGAIALWMSG